MNDALSIYREEILLEAQNPERQILYWIDHAREALADEFRCFAIQSKNSVIGYLQYSYFREEHIFFFEYLCIRDRNRSGLTHSDAVDVIKKFLADNYSPDFTIVFEVAHKHNENLGWERDKKLTSYFTRLGFRVVDFPYRYPVLQAYDGKSSYPADLMVSLPSEQTVLTSSGIRTILRCIYFKHYLRWDRPFLNADNFQKREQLIEALYRAQTAKIGSDDIFKTSGDDRRSFRINLMKAAPRISDLLNKIFGPKMPRIAVVMIALLGAQWLLGNGLLLIPFVLAVAIIYCLGEDTESSRKLLTAVVSKLSISRQRA
ncbi:hypothetical protein ACJMQP_22040 [Rhodopseudomonas palustris]